MKKNILVLVVSLVLFAGMAFANGPDVNFAGDYTDVDMSLAKGGYTAALPDLAFADADAIAKKVLAYAAAPMVLKKNGDFLLYKNEADNSASLRIDRVNGDLVFNKGFAALSGDNSTPNLPGKNEAQAIARQHLTSLGFLPKGGMELSEVTTFKKSVANGPTYDKLTLVFFKRKLAGLPVIGASRIVVMLGENGELAGLIVRWLDVSPSGSAGVVGANMRDYVLGKVTAKQADNQSVVIKTSELVMYDDGKGVIEPALFVNGEVSEDGVTFSACDWMLPVLTEPKADYPK